MTISDRHLNVLQIVVEVLNDSVTCHGNLTLWLSVARKQ